MTSSLPMAIMSFASYKITAKIPTRTLLFFLYMIIPIILLVVGNSFFIPNSLLYTAIGKACMGTI
jgi:hypothetical protein